MVMVNLEGWFPNRQLEPEETRHITELCGGPPIDNPEYINDFFRFSAAPLLKGSMFGVILNMASAVSADNLDVERSHGAKMFRNGALFYLGVLAETSPITSMPCEPRVVSTIADEDSQRFIWSAWDRLHDECDSFCSLISVAAPGLGADKPKSFQLAMVGAGFAHLMTVESLEYQNEAARMDAEHQEFAEMDAIFDEIMKRP